MPLSPIVCWFPVNPAHRFPFNISYPLFLILSKQPDINMPPVYTSSFSFWVSLLFFCVVSVAAADDDDGRETPPSPSNPIADQSFVPPIYPLFSPTAAEATPFRPSVAAIVGVLTTLFSITFILLLYAKHCKRGGNRNPSSSTRPLSSAATRKNSGIERTVIESLPIFRFSSLRGQKEGLECAVCLNGFEGREILRLLPKCKHAFHVECVDTWLDAHSTCPLCRYRVDPEDILLVEETRLGIVGSNKGEENRTESNGGVVYGDADLHIRNSDPIEIHRMSGRHSSAGEKTTSRFLVQRPLTELDSWSSRPSLDTYLRKKNEAVTTVGRFDRGGRKDGLLLPPETTTTTFKDTNRENFLRRFEHRIIFSSNNGGGIHRRWSDLRPSDLIFLRSKMNIENTISRYSMSANKDEQEVRVRMTEEDDNCNIDGNGRNVINLRSVSEITGLSRFGGNQTQKKAGPNSLMG